jgi:hypothetical protein
MKSKKTEGGLEEQVKDAIGAEVLARLAKQPLAIAAGGIAAVLQSACKEAAGFPDPLAAAIAKTRVACGSKATPATKN